MVYKEDHFRCDLLFYSFIYLFYFIIYLFIFIIRGYKVFGPVYELKQNTSLPSTVRDFNNNYQLLYPYTKVSVPTGQFF